MVAQKTPRVVPPGFWFDDEVSFNDVQGFGSERPIVVLDSGVGGLTVVRQLERLIPGASILYVVDNDWYPYGNKPGSAVAGRVQQLFDQLCNQVKPSAFVLACNTASIALIEHGFEPRNHHVFSVVPLIEEALEVSVSKQIVLLATPGTVKSDYICHKVAGARMHANLWSMAAQSLVTLSERKLSGQKPDFKGFSDWVSDQLTAKERLSVDTVILGCTHFPHLIDELNEIFPSVEHWVDPANKIALQVFALTGARLASTHRPAKAAIFTRQRGASHYQRVLRKNGFISSWSYILSALEGGLGRGVTK
ncbi:glutamate racemase [Pseudomonas sp. MN1F]|uniref:glutamate racemase n=1 Tax=Pseudomonas sp. MN1F TaxID=1366632 RepID=UPI0015B75A69|nr:aspartate/glutamate racemase family protein [Pseudomonas sp. MN1F]